MTEPLSPDPIELGTLAENLGSGVRSISFVPTAISLFVPNRLLYTDVLYFRHLLLFENADDPSVIVIGGYVDAVTLRPDDPEAGDRLHSVLTEIYYPRQAERLGDLVADPPRLARTLSQADAQPEPELMVLVLNIFIDPCFRGRDFGLMLLQSVRHYGMRFNDWGAPPVFVVYLDEDTPQAVAEHWSAHLPAVLTNEDLIVLRHNATLPDIDQIMDACSDSGYITVDADALRARLAAGDDTLTPLSDGRHPPEVFDTDDEEPDLEEQASEAAEIAIAALSFTDTLTAEVATVLRFSCCTSGGVSALSEPFHTAAEYLDEHPEVDVVSASWSDEPCPSGPGRHQTLVLTVRVLRVDDD